MGRRTDANQCISATVVQYSHFNRRARSHMKFDLRLGAHVLIRAYQLSLSGLIGRQCRHLPTCSAFADEAILRHGLWAGGWMGARSAPMAMIRFPNSGRPAHAGSRHGGTADGAGGDAPRSIALAAVP
jgi:hypothetical protein